MIKIKNDYYQIEWDPKDKIGRARAFGVWDEQVAQAMNKEYLRLSEEHGGKADWLIDLSNLKKVSVKARKALVDSTSSPRIGKNAYVGASVFIRVLANFILSASGKKDARHFSNEAEALKWLKEND